MGNEMPAIGALVYSEGEREILAQLASIKAIVAGHIPAPNHAQELDAAIRRAEQAEFRALEAATKVRAAEAAEKRAADIEAENIELRDRLGRVLAALEGRDIDEEDDD